jgi:hypothetical protein
VITRYGLTGPMAPYPGFASKEESGAVARAVFAAVPYHRATAPMADPQIPRRRKRLTPFPSPWRRDGDASNQA